MTRHPTERSSPAHTASTRAVAARRSVWVLSAIAMAGLLTGCARMSANLSPEHFSESQEQFTAVDRHSSYPAIRRNAFESINIIELVDPDREHEIRYSKAFKIAMSRQHSDQQSERDSSYGIRYDLALAAFRERPETPGYSKVAHRNAVQDRIMGVATSRCNVFKTHLRREQADTNFYLGAATTVAGVLGAILPGATASRNLAGTAGIFSGLQAEFNSNYYSNLAAHVIVQGIEQHQARLQTKIIDERQKLSIDAYGMEAAIKDAIYFDGTCSTVVGLLEAAESIKESSNPGLARSAEVIAATRAMHLIANEKDFAGLIKSGELDKLIKQASVKSSPLVVTALAAQAAPLPPHPHQPCADRTAGQCAFSAIRDVGCRGFSSQLPQAAKGADRRQAAQGLSKVGHCPDHQAEGGPAALASHRGPGQMHRRFTQAGRRLPNGLVSTSPDPGKRPQAPRGGCRCPQGRRRGPVGCRPCGVAAGPPTGKGEHLERSSGEDRHPSACAGQAPGHACSDRG